MSCLFNRLQGGGLGFQRWFFGTSKAVLVPLDLMAVSFLVPIRSRIPLALALLITSFGDSLTTGSGCRKSKEVIGSVTLYWDMSKYSDRRGSRSSTGPPRPCRRRRRSPAASCSLLLFHQLLKDLNGHVKAWIKRHNCQSR